MTPKQWAGLAIRVLAVYAIINSLGWLQSTLATLSFAWKLGIAKPSSISIWEYVSAFTPFIAFGSFGVLLWVFADTVAYYMVDNTDTTEHDAASSDLQPVQILTIAFCLIGIWIALSPLPRLLSAFVPFFFSGTRPPFTTANPTWLPAEITIGLVQIIIGAGLFFRARTLADKLVARYRLVPVRSEE